MTEASQPLSTCPGCKARLPQITGPVHAYMESSPACYACFNQILAAEYSDAALLATHRLTVDTYAVQHPGALTERRQIQSVGLHLARLGWQLEHPSPPKETNDVMLGLGPHKHTLKRLDPPDHFPITATDVAPFAGTGQHIEKVQNWARATWEAYAPHHDYIRDWTARYL